MAIAQAESVRGTFLLGPQAEWKNALPRKFFVDWIKANLALRVCIRDPVCVKFVYQGHGFSWAWDQGHEHRAVSVGFMNGKSTTTTLWSNHLTTT